MDVLLWIGWGCTLAVLLFLCLIGIFGALALKSPNWDLAFHHLARGEMERRGLMTRRLSTSETISRARFFGQKNVPGHPDVELWERTVDTVAVLAGMEDRANLGTDLAHRGEVVLASSLSSVAGSVQRISNLNLASWVWTVRKRAASFQVLFRGLVWFLPLCFRQVARVIERYMSVATILGIAGGLLYWGFSKGLNDQGVGGVAWVSFVSLVVTVGTVMALVLAVGQQFLRVLVAVGGPMRTWTRQRILGLAFMLVVAVSLLTLVESGVWAQWQLDVGDFISEQISHTPIGEWVPKILLIGGTAWLILRTFAWVRARWVKLGDRMTALATAVCLTLFEVLLVLFMLEAPSAVVRPVIYAFSWSMVVLGVLSAGSAVVDWISKCRALRGAGVDVPRGWFRWWALWAWCGAVAAITALGFVPQMSYAALGDTWLYVFISLATDIVSLVLFLLFLPGIFVAGRYVHRVSKIFERHSFDQAVSAFDAKQRDEGADNLETIEE